MRPADALRHLLRRLAPYLRRRQRPLATALLALLASAGLRLLEPWPLKLVFDRVFDSQPAADLTAGLGSGQLLLLAAVAILAVTALRAGTEYLSKVRLVATGNRVLAELRYDAYRHLQGLSLDFHARSRGGDLMLRLMSDVGLLRDVVTTALLPLLASGLVLSGMVVVMLWMDWRLALVALAPLPLFAWAARLSSRRIRLAAREQRAREGALAASASESIGAIKVVQALALEERFAQAFQRGAEATSGGEVRIARLAARLERGVDVLIALSTALLLVYGGRRVLHGLLTPGDLLVFLTYLRRTFNPVQDFAKYTGRLAKASAAGERVVSLLDEERQIRDRPGALAAPRLRGEVRFAGVGFAYSGGAPVLEEIDFIVAPGRRVALVGPSGIGKSTIVSLLLRLYDPTRGRILADGHDLRDLQLATLRAQIGVVLQETVLFAASVWENLEAGAPGASREAIVAAARLANADGFVRALPQGYNTVLGERGVTLSGGERQRLAIARAALRDAPILVLDEPTTGLDEENRHQVVEALDRLARGRTTFIVSHDLEVAASADEILFLEDRGIRERGTHRELLARGGRYAALWRLQRSPFAVGEEAHAQRA